MMIRVQNLSPGYGGYCALTNPYPGQDEDLKGRRIKAQTRHLPFGIITKCAALVEARDRLAKSF